jgi:hypothetical protein
VGRKLITGVVGGSNSTGTLAPNGNTITPATANTNLIFDANGTAQTVITGPATISNATSSISVSTGAFVASGGLGIEQNLHIGGLVAATGGNTMPVGISPATPAAATFTTVTANRVTATAVSEVSAQKTSATGTVTHDYTESNIWYHSSISANFTVNLTNVPTTNGYSTTVSLILAQGGTARYASGFQIDGVAQTVRFPGFLGSFTPTANRVEVQTFVLTRISSAWIVRTYFSVFGDVLGTSPLTAADSATAIKLANPSAASGLYWIKPADWTYPALCYCEMTLHGGGWVYLMQRLCANDQGLPGSYLTSQLGAPNHTIQNFYGVRDLYNNALTPQAMWNGLIGSSGTGKVFAREIQVRTGTVGGGYSESQRYTSSSDGPIWTYTTFSRLFSGNFSNGVFRDSLNVYLDNGATTVTGKAGTTWSSPALATINNGNVDQNLYFCNGEDGGDANWSFALMKGGTPYPRTADSTNGGNRHDNITRWAIIGIKA